MPSPLTHAAMGYAIYRLCRPQIAGQTDRPTLVEPALLVAIGVSLLPDLDVIPGLLFGNLGRFHNNMSHSLVFGLFVAATIAAVVWIKRATAFVPWFTLGLLSYELHVLLDFLTIGRGVMLFWPFVPDRYQAPIKLFYGLHWSQGWISPQHVWTAVSELALILLVVVVLRVYTMFTRSEISAP